MRVLFALPGIHRYNRGAEVAFIAIGKELASLGDDVTLIGSGASRQESSYRFLRAPSVARELFEWLPSMPIFRDECAFEELTFVPNLLRCYRPQDYDVTITCSYPFTNWVLTNRTFRGRCPPHVFVTENGDWPAFSNDSEYRYFHCDGLICTNRDFFERNQLRWNCRTIPNGVDCVKFSPGPPEREEFKLPADRPIVLMVSALAPNKRVEAGIEAVSKTIAHLVVAGDGPRRQFIDALAAQLLGDRFTRLLVTPDRMPALYRSANVVLHLTKEESFGNVFVEAMACGLPIVAHDSPRLRWLIGEGEYLHNTDDPNLTAQYISLALTATAARRQKLVMRSELFSWSRVGRAYQEFLNEIVFRWPGKSRGSTLTRDSVGIW
jgi:glycosyltransferase involved in cell wall biosynthesis